MECDQSKKESSRIMKWIGLLWIFTLCGFVHMPRACLKENKYLVHVPVCNVYVKPSERSALDTQILYGHLALLLQDDKEGWMQIETEDGATGFVRRDQLIFDQPIWRTSQRLCRTKAIGAIIYEEPYI